MYAEEDFPQEEFELVEDPVTGPPEAAPIPSIRVLTPPYKNIGRYGVKLENLSLSIFNHFIPLSALPNGDVMEDGKIKILSYHHVTDIAHTIPGKEELFIDRLFTHTTNHSGDLSVILKKRLVNNRYLAETNMLSKLIADSNASRGYRVIPLLVLCVKNQYLWKVSPTDLDPKYLTLVVNKELMNSLDTDATIVSKLVKKEYIDVMDDKYGIDILYTNDVEDLCYNQRWRDKPKFASLEDIQKHVENINEDVHNIIKMEVETAKKKEDEARAKRLAQEAQAYTRLTASAAATSATSSRYYV